MCRREASEREVAALRSSVAQCRDDSARSAQQLEDSRRRAELSKKDLDTTNMRLSALTGVSTCLCMR